MNRKPPDNTHILNENDKWLNKLNKNSYKDDSIQLITFQNPFRFYKTDKKTAINITETSGKCGNNLEVTSSLAKFSSKKIFLKQLDRRHNRKQLYLQGDF